MITTLGKIGQNVLHLMHGVFVLEGNYICSRLCLSYLLVSEVVSWLSTAARKILVTYARDTDFPESSGGLIKLSELAHIRYSKEILYAVYPAIFLEPNSSHKYVLI